MPPAYYKDKKKKKSQTPRQKTNKKNKKTKKVGLSLLVVSLPTPTPSPHYYYYYYYWSFFRLMLSQSMVGARKEPRVPRGGVGGKAPNEQRGSLVLQCIIKKFERPAPPPLLAEKMQLTRAAETTHHQSYLLVSD